MWIHRYRPLYEATVFDVFVGWLDDSESIESVGKVRRKENDWMRKEREKKKRKKKKEKESGMKKN